MALRVNQVVLVIMAALFLLCAVYGVTNGTIVLGFIIMASLPSIMIMTIKTNKTGWYIAGFVVCAWCIIASITNITNIINFLFLVFVAYNSFLLVTNFPARNKEISPW